MDVKVHVMGISTPVKKVVSAAGGVKARLKSVHSYPGLSSVTDSVAPTPKLVSLHSCEAGLIAGVEGQSQDGEF